MIFIPWPSKDYEDFFVPAWSPPSLPHKVTKPQTKFLVHWSKTHKKGTASCNTEVTGSTDGVILAWRPEDNKDKPTARQGKDTTLLTKADYCSWLCTNTAMVFLGAQLISLSNAQPE